MSSRDTIFALSSGRPPAAIAVVRISGPRAGDALKALSGRIPAPRQAALARVRDPQSGELIDEALALWFPAPNSETGEDVAELQLHGGRAVVAGTLAALGRIEGLRPAEAGEFTRRGFENGKLDLTAVEGLADLVAAETEGQRRQALRQMRGALGTRAESWREKLIQALALVEAGIDFSDEGDVPENLLAPALAIARELETEIASALADGRRGERLREGLVVAIAGPPNAGKSTLLNRLAQREAAIVSPYAGTTRDVIEVHLDLDGLPLTLLDTAGIRETDDPVEMEGVRRARAKAAEADLVLWVVDASTAGPAAGPGGGVAGGRAGDLGVGVGSGTIEPPKTAADLETADRSRAVPAQPEKPDNLTRAGTLSAAEAGSAWLLWNKIDLLDHGMKKKTDTILHEKTFDSAIRYYERGFTLSATSGSGLDTLIAALKEKADQFLGGEPALVTRDRQRRALEDALAALRRALARPTSEDLLAEELRLAARALARLTGRVDVEDVLDVIFRDFCVGK